MLMDACLFKCDLYNDSVCRAHYTVSYDNEAPKIAVLENKCEEQFHTT
jgi:hypothetical protein